MHTSQVPRSPPGPKYAILTVNPCPRPQRHPGATMCFRSNKRSIKNTICCRLSDGVYRLARFICNRSMCLQQIVLIIILTADLQLFLFPLPRGLVVVLPLFWFFRILIAAGLLADRASASPRVSHDAPARRSAAAGDGADASSSLPLMVRSLEAKHGSHTLFRSPFHFCPRGGNKQQSSRALSVYAGQSLERVHLIHLINITLARL